MVEPWGGGAAGGREEGGGGRRWEGAELESAALIK